MDAKNKYFLPVNKGDIIGIKREGVGLHKGNLKYSIDYKLPEKSPVFAAADGIVVYVRDDSNVRGLGKKYLNEGNAIVIKHKNKEYTRYEHLMFRGVVVKVGARVKAGKLIGWSGNTGYSSAPHLHFQVFRITGENPDKDFETLKTNL